MTIPTITVPTGPEITSVPLPRPSAVELEYDNLGSGLQLSRLVTPGGVVVFQELAPWVLETWDTVADEAGDTIAAADADEAELVQFNDHDELVFMVRSRLLRVVLEFWPRQAHGDVLVHARTQPSGADADLSHYDLAAQFRYPIASGRAASHTLILPQYSGLAISRPTLISPTVESRTAYPGSPNPDDLTASEGVVGSMQWASVYDRDTRVGMMVRSDDAKGTPKAIGVLGSADELSLTFRLHWLQANRKRRAGQPWASDHAFILRPRVGEWADDAAYYRHLTMHERTELVTRGRIKDAADVPTWQKNVRAVFWGGERDFFDHVKTDLDRFGPAMGLTRDQVIFSAYRTTRYTMSTLWPDISPQDPRADVLDDLEGARPGLYTYPHVLSPIAGNAAGLLAYRVKEPDGSVRTSAPASTFQLARRGMERRILLQRNGRDLFGRDTGVKATQTVSVLYPEAGTVIGEIVGQHLAAHLPSARAVYADTAGGHGVDASYDPGLPEYARGLAGSHYAASKREFFANYVAAVESASGISGMLLMVEHQGEDLLGVASMMSGYTWEVVFAPLNPYLPIFDAVWGPYVRRNNYFQPTTAQMTFSVGGMTLFAWDWMMGLHAGHLFSFGQLTWIVEGNATFWRPLLPDPSDPDYTIRSAEVALWDALRRDYFTVGSEIDRYRLDGYRLRPPPGCWDRYLEANGYTSAFANGPADDPRPLVGRDFSPLIQRNGDQLAARGVANVPLTLAAAAPPHASVWLDPDSSTILVMVSNFRALESTTFALVLDKADYPWLAGTHLVEVLDVEAVEWETLTTFEDRLELTLDLAALETVFLRIDGCGVLPSFLDPRFEPPYYSAPRIDPPLLQRNGRTLLQRRGSREIWQARGGRRLGLDTLRQRNGRDLQARGGRAILVR